MSKEKAPPPDLTLAEFLEHSRPMLCSLAGHVVQMKAKKFSTGSVGWHGQDKLSIQLENGKQVKCMVNFLVTVIGSKDIEVGVVKGIGE